MAWCPKCTPSKLPIVTAVEGPALPAPWVTSIERTGKGLNYSVFALPSQARDRCGAARYHQRMCKPMKAMPDDAVPCASRALPTTKWSAWVVIGLAVAFSSMAQPVYRWVDKDGKVHYSGE